MKGLRLTIFVAIALGVAIAGLAGPVSEPRTSADPERAVIAGVTDGDTLDIELPGGAIESVRLIGIDTPEVYFGAECGGEEASAAIHRFDGKPVRLIADASQADRDRYGRLLRYVEVLGGSDVGRKQVAAGLASVYVYDSTPFARVRAYRRAASRARARGLGLWASCPGGSP